MDMGANIQSGKRLDEHLFGDGRGTTQGHDQSADDAQSSCVQLAVVPGGMPLA
jgi:hypothetical protein